MELASIFHGLGTETHLFFRNETLLRHGFDPFIVDTLMAEMTAHGPELHAGFAPHTVSKAADGTLTVEACRSGWGKARAALTSDATGCESGMQTLTARRRQRSLRLPR